MGYGGGVVAGPYGGVGGFRGGVAGPYGGFGGYGAVGGYGYPSMGPQGYPPMGYPPMGPAGQWEPQAPYGTNCGFSAYQGRGCGSRSWPMPGFGQFAPPAWDNTWYSPEGYNTAYPPIQPNPMGPNGMGPGGYGGP